MFEGQLDMVKARAGMRRIVRNPIAVSGTIRGQDEESRFELVWACGPCWVKQGRSGQRNRGRVRAGMWQAGGAPIAILDQGAPLIRGAFCGRLGLERRLFGSWLPCRSG